MYCNVINNETAEDNALHGNNCYWQAGTQLWTLRAVVTDTIETVIIAPSVYTHLTINIHNLKHNIYR